MNYNEYIKIAYDTACKHGFHDKELPLDHWLMLVITEVSEMVEADRKGKRAQSAMFKRECSTPQPNENKKKHWLFCFDTFVKDSFEDEMADACIRLFDLSGLLGFEYKYHEDSNENYLRQYKEASVTEKAFALCLILTRNMATIEWRIENALFYLVSWAKAEGIDLEWHIAQKMKYNKQRARLHGKKY